MIDELDRSLERWLRAAVPLPANVAEIGFDAPERDWDARRSTPLVDLFLYAMGPSKGRAATGSRVIRGEEGYARVAEVPVVEARYLISVWGGGSAVEHDLLGRVVNLLAASRAIPDEFLGDRLRRARPPLTLSMAPDESTSPTQLWSALSVPPRPAVQLLVETPAGLPVPVAVNDPPTTVHLTAADRRGPAARDPRRRHFSREDDLAARGLRAGPRTAVVQDSGRRNPAVHTDADPNPAPTPGDDDGE